MKNTMQDCPECGHGFFKLDSEYDDTVIVEFDEFGEVAEIWYVIESELVGHADQLRCVGCGAVYRINL